jgi:hypothetical protein
VTGSGYESDVVIFVDESGNEDLEVGREGASPLFVASAIIVRTEDLPAFRAGVHRLEANLGDAAGNDERSLDVAQALAELPFTFVVEATDKHRISRDTGLRFRASFRKFLLAFLYDRLDQAFTGARVIADRHGSPTFGAEFADYMGRRFSGNLFHPSLDIDFAESASEPGIRVAGVVAGIYARLIEEGAGNAILVGCRELLRPQELRAQLWPPPIRSERVSKAAPHPTDQAIRELMLGRSAEFVDRYLDNPDEMTRAQAAVLQILLSKQVYENPEEHPHYLAAGLKLELVARGHKDFADQAFRRSILGPIRDQGIILAGTPTGMRIATCMADVADYRNQVSSIILPMIGRLSRSRKDLRLHQAIATDILGGPEQVELRRIVEAMDDVALLARETVDERGVP